jgi:hypothetical protein
LPIRGRYLALQLVPEADAPYHERTYHEMVLFFVPERTLPFEEERLELWAEVTVPRAGPPRPIRLGVKREGRIEAIEVR